jgi:hypothetical protein
VQTHHWLILALVAFAIYWFFLRGKLGGAR